MGELQQHEFKGTERYTVRRCLGGGTLGVVYEGYDRKRKAVVALKALRSFSSGSLYRLKQEFRSLADLSHPNLVSLYELIGSENGWFISMEMVKGVDFYRHVRGVDAPNPLSSATWMSNELTGLESDPSAHQVIEQPEASLTPDLARLQSALSQLLSGLAALHAAGKLHRDIKPSNVLVTSEGRVVVVDFGLVYDADRAASELSRIDKVMGTVAFIAPEQLLGTEPTAQCDMYSVGVLLYQGLTGKLPFAGSMVEMLRKKQSEDAPRPSSEVQGVPQLLDDLCAALMSRDPTRRPSAVEALVRLGQDPGSLARHVRAHRRADRIEGREAERRFLEEAYQRASAGRLVVGLVKGESGLGKTSLVEHFLRDLREREEVTILRGRCYERESVPFKAFDSLMDGLRRRLKRLPPEEVERVMPPDMYLLARLFPVLRELLLEDDPTDVAGVEPSTDPFDQRLRAFRACRDLMQNLARERPVIAFLDDVQWGDADSARMLAGWLKGLVRSRLLVVLAYRSEDEHSSAFLTSLFNDPVYVRSEVRELKLNPLSATVATAVARAMLSDNHPNPTEAAVWIAEEAAGNPHLMSELANSLKASAGAGGAFTRQSLDELLRSRVMELPEEAQRLLRFVAIAGRPLPLRVLARAAELPESMQAIAVLRTRRLVRTNQGPLGELVELYHNRVGSAVREGRTPEELSRAHLAVARAMESERWDDPEALMMHYLSAGDQDRAGQLALDAAQGAIETLAFDKAAELFRTAIELGTWDTPTAEDLRIRLADALVYAGRGEQAARVYLDAARSADAGAAIELRRNAAEQLVSNGYVDEGIVLLREVLSEVGLQLPTTARSALVGYLGMRVCIWWKGMRFEDSRESTVDAADLQRIDICWFVALAFSVIDPMRGAYFHGRGMLYALEAGERYRVLRALSMELPMMVQSGAYDWNEWSRLLKRTKALANKLARAQGTAIVFACEGMSAYIEGRFKNAYRLLKQAEKTYVELCPGATFELALTRLFALRALLYTGELRAAREQRHRILEEAAERGNLLLTSNLRSDLFVLLPLMRGDPDRAAADLAAARSQWSRSGWHYQHLFAARGAVYLNAYQGRGDAAWGEIEAIWPHLHTAQLHRTASARVMMHDARGTAALLVGDAAHVKIAEQSARALLKDRYHRLAAPTGHLLMAGVWTARGNPERAMQAFELAAEGFDKVELVLHHQVARWRLGKLRGGREGEALVQAAEGWFTNQGVVNVPRLCAALSPFSDNRGA